jgi:predicted secreted Zn-dependent protease
MRSDGDWQKSTTSADGACVEVRTHGECVQVRDSKYRAGPVLSFSSREWRAFLEGVRLGEFDHED